MMNKLQYLIELQSIIYKNNPIFDICGLKYFVIKKISSIFFSIVIISRVTRVLVQSV
jgi:hypothetical protein